MKGFIDRGHGDWGEIETLMYYNQVPADPHKKFREFWESQTPAGAIFTPL